MPILANFQKQFRKFEFSKLFQGNLVGVDKTGLQACFFALLGTRFTRTLTAKSTLKV
jgi:hypothetical protein